MKKQNAVLLVFFFLLSNHLFSQKSKIKSQEPSFPGGNEAMYQFFADSLRLPQSVYNGYETYVTLKVTINENGELTNPKVKNRPDLERQTEAIRAVLSMPKWNPYIKNHNFKSKTIVLNVPFYIPRDKYFQFKRAQFYYNQGKYGLAYLAAERAIDKDSLNVEIYKLMTEICLKNGEADYACAYLSKGIKLGVSQCQEIYDAKCNVINVLSLSELKSKKYKDVVVSDPQWENGTREIIGHIVKNARYPTTERKLGIDGQAYVTFIVSEEGDILDVDILRGVSPGIDRESLRVISTLPKPLQPAKVNNENVPVRLIVPVNFKLI